MRRGDIDADADVAIGRTPASGPVWQEVAA